MNPKTYQSKEAVYELDPKDLFRIFGDLHHYLGQAQVIAAEHNENHFTPSVVLAGYDERLLISTEVLIEDTREIKQFTLAELVSSTGGLQLATHAHSRVLIDTDWFDHIVAKYAIDSRFKQR